MKLFKKVILTFYCVLCIGLISKGYASTLNHNSGVAQLCNATIQQIQVAKTHQGPLLHQTAQLQWQKLEKLPDYWSHRWADYTGAAWYKITWHQSCLDPENPVMLLIKSISMAGKIYLNDDVLWQDSALTEPLSRSWNSPRQWMLPTSSLKKGENILWVYVQGAPTYFSGLGQVSIGDVATHQPIFEHYIFEHKTLHHIKVILNITIGLICLLIWGLQRRKELAVGLFGVSHFVWVAYVCAVLNEQPLFGLNSIDLQRLTIWFFSAYAVICCFYGNRFAEQIYPNAERILLILFGLSTIFLIFTPERVILPVLGGLFVFWAILCLSYYVLYVWIAYRAKMLEVYLLAIVYLCLVPIGVHDAIYMLNPADGRAISPYTTPITTLFITIILGTRFSKNVKRIEQFNQTLRHTIEQVKDELSHTLNTSHQLELENTKLQERIYLAHDLHDGLGSSLVRSMAMVSQSKQALTNQQTLSMLKLLRDDLRQIIDSGSSLETKIPETPLLWIAPVRYRFNMLFDELDIEANWRVASSWQLKLSALECLTLQRVLEEALANIIKHSHATQVEVDFYFEQHNQLILSIQDNGVGFDWEVVNASGLSVGLRSMKTRLEKMNAQMILSSVAGCTKIQVIKVLS